MKGVVEGLIQYILGDYEVESFSWFHIAPLDRRLLPLHQPVSGGGSELQRQVDGGECFSFLSPQLLGSGAIEHQVLANAGRPVCFPFLSRAERPRMGSGHRLGATGDEHVPHSGHSSLLADGQAVPQPVREREGGDSAGRGAAGVPGVVQVPGVLQGCFLLPPEGNEA